VELLEREEGDGMVVAGATAVSLMLHHRLIAPSALVALSRVPGLREITVSDGGMSLGTLVTHHQVSTSDMVARELPMLARTFGVVANHRVRAVATVGGVLAEADYASDPPTMLRALDARVVVVGPDGERRVPVGELVSGFYETSLRLGEIIRSVEVPLPAPRTVGRYLKYRSTSSEDRPCVGVATLVRRGEDGSCEEARVCVGAVSAVPLRLPDVERSACGRSLDAETAEGIAAAYAAAVRPLSDVRGSAWYRREMVRVLVARALHSCAQNGGEREADELRPGD
jgi:carbon-monoxide dehydrogenase medium subunit